MIDFEKEVEKHTQNLMNTDLDSYTFKSVFTSIEDDIREILIETGIEINKNITPNLVILTIVSPDGPCGVCEEAISQLFEWTQISGYAGDGKVRIIVIDEFDNRKIWRKLGMDFNDAPRHYIFDKNFRLYDVVDGVMQGSYIETFYKKLLVEN